MEIQFLLEGIKRGNEESFASLVRLYSQSCYRIAWRQLFDVQAAEDIVQEVLLTLWKKPDSWQPNANCRFETWLYRVWLIVVLIIKER